MNVLLLSERGASIIKVPRLHAAIRLPVPPDPRVLAAYHGPQEPPAEPTWTYRTFVHLGEGVYEERSA